MLVKELIAKLSEMPQNLEILTPSTEWIDEYLEFDGCVYEKTVDDEKVVILE